MPFEVSTRRLSTERFLRSYLKQRSNWALSVKGREIKVKVGEGVRMWFGYELSEDGVWEAVCYRTNFGRRPPLEDSLRTEMVKRTGPMRAGALLARRVASRLLMASVIECQSDQTLASGQIRELFISAKD
ncbi:hypothetical protein CU103_22625 [Phyllobacterium sophorae]|uniref:Uncharacterized protein n=1 Tax=Phyllobacterium sophorae TaxID=1520277 RepID=A0A2P7B564_9HYPH|nr:hypothetical protein CU103_22625 [Phyllobacterium sophorae]